MTEEQAIIASQILQKVTKFRSILKILEESMSIPEITFRCKSVYHTDTNVFINGNDVELKQIVIDSTKESLKNQIYKLEQEFKDL
jgi:hypothetical protein